MYLTRYTNRIELIFLNLTVYLLSGSSPIRGIVLWYLNNLSPSLVKLRFHLAHGGMSSAIQMFNPIFALVWAAIGLLAGYLIGFAGVSSLP